MEIKNYQKEVSRTLAPMPSSIDNDQLLNDIHMAMGMSTEVGEIVDVYKKNLAYGKEIDYVNVKEELGDLMWYIGNMCNNHGWELEEILQTNIDKLRVRFPEKFETEQALERDLSSERKSLEE